MTYYQLIEAFRQFASDHKQIKCFGYGNISDIETPVHPTTGQAIQRDYPYFFVNPTNHTYTQSMLTYSFNIIAMELVTEVTPTGFSGLNSVIKAQSDALLILNDFLAWIEYNTDIDTELVKNSSFTPFQERFQDNLAGMTVAVQIQVPNDLNLCEAPIGQYELTPYINVGKVAAQTIGSQAGEDRAITATEYYLNTGEWNVNRYTGTEDRTFTKIAISYNMRFVDTGTDIPEPFGIRQGGTDYPAYTTTGWPTAYDTEMHAITQEWLGFDANQGDLYFFRTPDGLDEYNMELTNVNITFYL